MNFVWNIFTPLLFYLTPPKVIFLLPSPVWALYLFLCALTPCFLHSSISCTSPFLQFSVCLQGVSTTRYPLYGCYSSIILFSACLLTLLLFFSYLFLPLSTFSIINAPCTLSAQFYCHMFIQFFQLSCRSFTQTTYLSAVNLSLSI